jgi:hypothetical protein
MTDKHPRENEPVVPSQRDTERDMDPTKRREDRTDDRNAPDMGGDMPRRDQGKDVPGGTTPTR